MNVLRTKDWQYTVVDQDDENLVVYNDTGVAIWDRRSYEAERLVNRAGSDIPQVIVQPTVLDQVPSSLPRVIRVTDDSDDAIVPMMYSYWANAWERPEDRAVFVFCGHPDGTPRFFRVDPGKKEPVLRLTLGDQRWHVRMPYRGTTEGWYWDAEGWVYLCDGPKLRRVNPFTGEDRIIVDTSARWVDQTDIWQAHSSDDGRVHSITVRQIQPSGDTVRIGTLVVRDGVDKFYEADGDLDESSVTHDGNFVVIKETPPGAKGVSNRIINTVTGESRTITNAQGALGHSDVGSGFVVGEWSPQNREADGQCALLDLNAPLVPKTLFKTWNMGYVAVRRNICLHSDGQFLSFVDLQNGGESGAFSHGNNDDGPSNPNYYDKRVKANLSPCGRWACYMSNNGTDRPDVYLMRMP